MAVEVRNATDRSRYELVLDGEVVGVADYVLRGDVVVMPHTQIDRDRRGQGLGAQLVQGALDDTRAAGRKVAPLCWYVAEFIDHNPAYADLLAH